MRRFRLEMEDCIVLMTTVQVYISTDMKFLRRQSNTTQSRGREKMNCEWTSSAQTSITAMEFSPLIYWPRSPMAIILLQQGEMIQTAALLVHSMRRQCRERERYLFAFCILAVSTYNCPADRKTYRGDVTQVERVYEKTEKSFPFFLRPTAQAQTLPIFKTERSSYLFQRRCKKGRVRYRYSPRM